MSREVIDYEGSTFCKHAGQSVAVIRAHAVYDDESTGGSKTKILCPYFYKSGWTGSGKCEKGGSCGIAEGMDN